jgi:hypothetical protein
MTVFILFLHSDYLYEIRTSEQTRCWVNIGFGSGLSTVASDRAAEREACSARAPFVGTIIFKKIVRRRNFMKNTILITNLAAAFGLSIKCRCSIVGRTARCADRQDGVGLESQGSLARSISHSQEQVPENNDRQGQGRGKGLRSILVLDGRS